MPSRAVLRGYARQLKAHLRGCYSFGSLCDNNFTAEGTREVSQGEIRKTDHEHSL